MKRSGSAAGSGLIGRSQKMENIRRLIGKAAQSRLPVLLLGESGTGKEVVARAIYDAAARGQFVPIDCGSLVGTLMESELFGHTRGSFSGATENKKGLVELADGGTAFFDEIGDLPLEMQVKLLRLIQEKEYRAVGALQWRKVDLRIVAATHRDLKRAAEEQRFRQDLYFRLNVIVIRVPPLRDRKEDIPELVEHFLEGTGWSGGVNPDTMAALLEYDWPGNVRELKNSVERMVATNSGGTLLPADLPSSLQNFRDGAELHRLSEVVETSYLPEFVVSPRQPVVSIKESERQTICNALSASGGDRGKAARALGIGRTTLYRKMKSYGIS
jgi:DNA-binding NtrC family response regulator